MDLFTSLEVKDHTIVSLSFSCLKISRNIRTVRSIKSKMYEGIRVSQWNRGSSLIDNRDDQENRSSYWKRVINYYNA